MAGRERMRVAQAWIEPLADDPEAISALAVARERLPAGRALEGLRRMRIFELSGALPERASLGELVHRSIQFYNPAKERCTLRLDPLEAAPLAADEIGVLVLERGGERRAAAERWWRHETGESAEIREGIAWVMRLANRSQAERAAEDLTILRGREHGLLCNPHWQQARIAALEIPLPWIAGEEPARGRGRSRSATPDRPARSRSAAQMKGRTDSRRRTPAKKRSARRRQA